MSERRLREFEELVLLSVLISAPDAYGPSLQQVLADEAGRDVSLGAIYTALDRLTRNPGRGRMSRVAAPAIAC